MDTVTILQWTLLSLIWCPILPYILWTLYVYLKHKRKMVYFQKRKPFLIDLVLALVVSGIFVENQSLLFLSIYDCSDTIFAALLGIFNMASMVGIYMTIMERIYLLYFQYEHSEAVVSQKWKEYVNETVEDFFLSNIHTYGNDKFLFKLTLILWGGFVAIYAVLAQFIPTLNSWFILVTFAVLFSFAAFVWRKFPDFNDTLYILSELQYFMALNGCVLLLWTLLIIVSGSDRVSDIIRAYLQVLMYCLITEISVHRVIQWNEVDHGKGSDDTLYVKQMKDRSFGLRQVIETSDGYTQFMKFLVTEFATENLLFVTEYVQMKGILSLSDKEMRSLKLTFDLSLPLDLPIPKIIQDLNLDLEQIKANQKYRADKRMKREKESLKLQINNKKRVMQEIVSKNELNKPKHTKHKQSLIEEVKQTENEKYTVSLAPAHKSETSNHNCDGYGALASTSPQTSPAAPDFLQSHISEEQSIEPTPSISPKDNTHISPKSYAEITHNTVSPHSAASVEVITEGTVVSDTNSNERISERYDSQTLPLSNTNEFQSAYSIESTVVIDAKESEMDVYGVPINESKDETETVLIDIERIKSMETVSKNKTEPILDKQSKSVNNSDFMKEIMKQKRSSEQSMRKQSEVSVNETDFSKIPSLSVSPTQTQSISSRYSKDDIETIKLKDGRHRKNRTLSSGIFRKSSDGDRHSKSESVASVRLQIVQKKQKLSVHIRQRSNKLKSALDYHMREASQSMALKMSYKKNEKFNVLNTKAFSLLCTKLYYKYVATGVAPLEVNISSNARIRCDNTFRAQQRLKLPHSMKKRDSKRGRTISSGVVSFLSRKNHLMQRNAAMDILRSQGGHVMRSQSQKKLTMLNSEEPFDGDIVRAMSQLLPPLEQCAVELTNLLTDSLSRFKKTQSCAKLYLEYCERKEKLQIINAMSDGNGKSHKQRNSKNTI